MKIVKFKESNETYAKNQPQYKQIPVFKYTDGDVVSCWKLSLWERLKLIFTGRVWVVLKTFNSPLQPQYISINKKDVLPSKL